MDGLLLVNKPKGMTSFAAVKRIKKLAGIKKVGHTGTLDPSARGLLLVCMGRATKLTPFLQELDKTYQGRMVFGVATSSFDEEGELVEEKDASSLDKEKVKAIFHQFEGKILQTPPVYSAVHWQGERLYNLARKGARIETSPRQVHIYELKLVSYLPGVHPVAEFEVRCSKGTYIRSLCHDIGEASGYGAYQASLCRVRIGPFFLEDATDLKEIEDMAQKGRLNEIILPPAEALPHFPKILVKKGVEKLVKWGRPIYLSHLSEISSNLEKGDRVRICSENGDLLAVGVSLQSGSYFVKDKVGFKYLRVLV